MKSRVRQLKDLLTASGSAQRYVYLYNRIHHEHCTWCKGKIYTLDIAPLRVNHHRRSVPVWYVFSRDFSFTCTPTRSSAIGMSHTCLVTPVIDNARPVLDRFREYRVARYISRKLGIVYFRLQFMAFHLYAPANNIRCFCLTSDVCLSDVGLPVVIRDTAPSMIS